MNRIRRTAGLKLGFLACLAAPAVAAQSQSAPPTAPATTAVPAVNDPAPDFSLTGATRYGVLQAPVRLSDFRGRTVVLAFFSRARTKG